MTQNQIRYLSYLEEQRANRERERENLRSNLAKERENARSNIAKETETNRANKRTEQLAQDRLDYEKYGNSKTAGIVRTIKAGLSDITKGVQEAQTGGPVNSETKEPIPVFQRDGKTIVNPNAVTDSNRDDVLEQLAKEYRQYDDAKLSQLSKKYYDYVHSGVNHGKLAEQAKIYLAAVEKVQNERKD